MTSIRYVSKLYGALTMACISLIQELGSGHAWLVGSALDSATRPRDVDVRIVLSDDDFQQRYGFGTEEWAAARITWPRTGAWWGYVHERERFETFLAHACGERNIDLGIVPASIFAYHENDPKERLA